MTAPNLELYTGEVEPQLNAQNQVVGFVAVGVNGTSRTTATSPLHVLCYTP